MGSQKTQMIEEHRNNPCEAEADVKKLIADLRKIKTKRDVVCGSLLLQLQELQDELHELALPFDQESEAIEANIKELMQQVEHTIKTEYGAANWRNGSLRVTYDYKGLDAIDDAKIQEVIREYRKETKVSPSVNVEVF